MITAVDTNVLVALLKKGDILNEQAVTALDSASATGSLVICGAVFAELMASPGATAKSVAAFLSDVRIDVDWTTEEGVWLVAGAAFSKYAVRRRKGRSGHPRRILADFLIGAHAYENRYPLLTLDIGLYRTAFPKLKLIGL